MPVALSATCARACSLNARSSACVRSAIVRPTRSARLYPSIAHRAGLTSTSDFPVSTMTTPTGLSSKTRRKCSSLRLSSSSACFLAVTSVSTPTRYQLLAPVGSTSTSSCSHRISPRASVTLNSWLYAEEPARSSPCTNSTMRRLSSGKRASIDAVCQGVPSDTSSGTNRCAASLSSGVTFHCMSPSTSCTVARHRMHLAPASTCRSSSSAACLSLASRSRAAVRSATRRSNSAVSARSSFASRVSSVMSRMMAVNRRPSGSGASLRLMCNGNTDPSVLLPRTPGPTPTTRASPSSMYRRIAPACSRLSSGGIRTVMFSPTPWPGARRNISLAAGLSDSMTPSSVAVTIPSAAVSMIAVSRPSFARHASCARVSVVRSVTTT